MAVTNNTLFPPILKDTQPAFIRTGECRIYFNLSQFNSIDEIAHAQITVINQKNNQNVLNSTYPIGIKVIHKNNFHQTKNDENYKYNDYKYYIILPSEDIIDGQFKLNQFYKIQIRFGNNLMPFKPNAKQISDNLAHFSEWSKVSLIKGISEPTISINTLDSSGVTQFFIPPTMFVGKLTFDNSEETETLKNFNITIYKNGENNPFINSGINYTSQYNPNQFNYELLYDFEKQILYTLEFTYTTINNYSATVNFDFKIRKEAENELNAIIDIAPEQNQGRIKINIAFKKLFKNNTHNLMIQRASSKTNFLKWENIKQLEYNNNFEKHYEDVLLNFISSAGYYNKNGIFINASGFKKTTIEVKSNQLYILTSKESTSNFNMARAFLIKNNNEINIIQNDKPSNGQLKETSIQIPEENNKIYMTIQTRSEDINNVKLSREIEETFIDSHYLWYDTTVESGVWYKYRVRQIAENGRVSAAQNPVICVFEDMFLTNNDRQLKIQFNPTVSDFRYNVNESQQITLGSQFPYIRRNGDNYYRSFSIGGLISALMDQQNWYDPNYNQDHGYFYNKNVAESFTTPQQLYGDAATALYENYNNINDINQYRDYIYEKQFRQKVMEFLYQNNPKLFRSLTEGNILIKLNNITFSPVESLGRMLYSFSATATEVDENNLENLHEYNLINKYYYTYTTLLITETFECGRSLIDRFYKQLPYLNKKTTDIMQLTFSNCKETADTENIDVVIYAKPINNKNLYRYVTQNGILTLSYSDADPIAESYFYGIHFDNPVEINEYYNSIYEIPNPQDGCVYYILEDGAYLINNYIKYYNDIDLLDTYRNQVVQNSNNDYALLAELKYYKMIYYNNQWYPYTHNNDIIMDNLYATVEYLYRIKKED